MIVIIVIHGTLVENDNISRQFFHFFQNFDFLGCYRGKKAKNVLGVLGG